MFVHTGFVEQYLVRHDIARRDFAVRLGIQALVTMVRELPTERPSEGAGFWDAVRRFADQALAWM